MIELNEQDSKPKATDSAGIDFNEPAPDPNIKGLDGSIIKVIGVGGGGGNAVNYMYRKGIHHVNFAVCNTDSKALADSPVPFKLQLGSGLGAGNKPEVARKAAEDDIEKIQNMLKDGTQMVFITAGMGGGTGTGAAPIVAREAYRLNILTVGIVTIPFLFEGKRKIDQALDGVEALAKNVDALLVINNERLREIYTDLSWDEAFEKANDTLNIAAKGISDIITSHGSVGTDFNDVKTVLKDGGVAIMSIGYGEGPNRVSAALKDALNSPLLNNNDIFNSKKVLFYIAYNAESPEGKLMITESDEINEFMGKFNEDIETKWGKGHDPELGNKVKITLLATGFGVDDMPIMYEKHQKEKQLMQEQIAEDQDRRAKIRERYYRPSDSNEYIKKRFQSYIFKDEDLDNADIISAVEATPTYKRTRETLYSISTKSTARATAQTTTEAEAQQSESGGIVFN